MKKIQLLLALNLSFICLQAQNFEWTKREGLWEYDYGYGIDTDNSGNVYISGKYEMNANFSGTIIPQQGNHDIYVAKYNSAGALIWVRTAGGSDGDYARALACDGNYVYVAGEIEGYQTVISFLGSPVTLTCKGVNDAFLAKYDLEGNLLWAKQAGGINNDEALGITYDNSGNVYVCGFYSNGAVFGTTALTTQGGYDMYVAKYDANGEFQWVRTAGGPGRDEAKSIKCDAAGNIYVGGMHKDGAVFGSNTLSSPNGYLNAFIAKYTPNGTLEWAKSAGGDYDDAVWSLTIANNNNVYITGEFNAYAHFDNIAIPTTGSADIFVACYDPSGTIQWVKKAGGSLLDRARGIGCDGTNLYITGQFSMSANFGSIPVTGVDSSEIFIAKLNNSGDFQWVKVIGGPSDLPETLGYESGNAICAEASGNVYTTGSLLNGGVFGSTSFNAYSRTDVFLSKISQEGVTAITFNQTLTICAGESITVGTHTYTASGNYTDLLVSYQNLDSTVITFLTVQPAITISQTKTICEGESITIGTHTYSSAGNYTDVLTSYHNCDSTVNTNLVLVADLTLSQTKTICDGESITVGSHTYTSNGNYTDVLSSAHDCDSTVNTHLIVLPAIAVSQTKKVCSGESVSVGTHTYTTSGNYTDVLTSSNNCDSTVTTHLTVMPVITVSQTKTICAGQNITIGSHTYTNSGNYTDVLNSYKNCDSTVTTHLTVLPAITFTQTKTICAGQSITVGANSYTISGDYTDVLISSTNSCDSTVTTHLTVLPAISFSQTKTLCAGESITIGSHTHSTSGIYTDYLISSVSSCDSTVTTELIINSIDTTVSVSTITLTSNATPAAYQWIDCNGNIPISDQINQSFVVSVNGSFAVIVTQNSCSDTSSCFTVEITDISENSIASFIKIYPNPFTYQTTISFSQEQKQTHLKIMDDLGKEIKNLNFSGKELIIEKGELSPGIYFLQVKTELGIVSKKMVISK